MKKTFSLFIFIAVISISPKIYSKTFETKTIVPSSPTLAYTYPNCPILSLYFEENGELVYASTEELAWEKCIDIKKLARASALVELAVSQKEPISIYGIKVGNVFRLWQVIYKGESVELR